VSALLGALLCLLSLAGQQAPPRSDFDAGVDAYRQGQYGAARERWESALCADLAPVDRARVLYDLGNAHWRLGDPQEAIVCYTEAVRLDPRQADGWQNLELARAKSELPPADPGNLRSTLQRLLSSLRPDEARLLLYGALVLWVLALAVEIRIGGSAGRWVLGTASGGLLLALLPWAWGRLQPERGATAWVVQSAGATLRAEPLPEREALGELAVLEEVERIDELPGWTRVQRADGTRGWVRAEALYRPPEPAPLAAAGTPLSGSGADGLGPVPAEPRARGPAGASGRPPRLPS